MNAATFDHDSKEPGIMRYFDGTRALHEQRTAPIRRSSPPRDLRYHLAKEIGTRLWRLMQDQTHYLIVARADVNYYVQFMPTDSGQLHSEAVSNDFLVYQGEDHRISTKQELQLLDFGWSPSPINFTQLWEPPVPYCEVGIVAARTLIEVYGTTVAHTIDLKFGEIQC